MKKRKEKKNIFFTLGWNAFICLLRPSKTTSIKMWARPHDISAFLSLSPSLSLSLAFFSLPRYFDVCVYITWRIKLHVSDDLSPYNNPQKVGYRWILTRGKIQLKWIWEILLSPFVRINTESGIWRWMDFYFLVHSSGFLISSVSAPHHALWNILHVPFRLDFTVTPVTSQGKHSPSAFWSKTFFFFSTILGR